MSAKKKTPGRRGEKFLSRTQLEARARRAARWARVKEVIGVALVALTIAAIISLISHHPQDRSFNASTPSDRYHNYLGGFGSFLSDLLVQFFGFGAYFFPLFTFGLAVGCFVPLARSRLSLALRLSGGALFCLSTISLGGLFLGADPLYPTSPAGGVTGKALAELLAEGAKLKATGAFLVLFFSFLTGVMLMTTVTIRQAAGAAAGGGAALWQSLLQRRRLAKGRAQKAKPRPPAPAKSRPPAPLPPAAGEPRIVEHPVGEGRRGKTGASQESLDFPRPKGTFVVPPLSLLEDSPAGGGDLSRDELIANSRILERKLLDFGVSGRVTHVHPGPVITMYEFAPSPGVKVNRIVNLSDDLALAMSALSVRVVAPIPGKSVVGIEIPNHQHETVCLKEILLSEEFRRGDSKLSVALGKDIFGRPAASDLGRMPHILIAGATGSGKSVMINSMISSILFNATPGEVQFIMIDPKMVELTVYDGIPHLIAPVVSNPKKAAYALRNAVGIMEERYRTLAEQKVRNIESYNKLVRRRGGGVPEGEKPLEPMPYMVLVIDELADLMILAQSDVEDSITRLAQLSRAVGMHLVIATQRPSTNVITGIIKANLPVRIAFQVSSKIDSRVILDANGAEQLLGRGDMLYLPPGTNKLQRLHGSFISEEEVKRLVEHLKTQGRPSYDESILKAPPVADTGESDGEEDEMYDQAVALVTGSGQASISYIQRKLRVGYNRAARMLEAMEKAGIVGPAEGARPRKILARRSYEE